MKAWKEFLQKMDDEGKEYTVMCHLSKLSIVRRETLNMDNIKVLDSTIVDPGKLFIFPTNSMDWPFE